MSERRMTPRQRRFAEAYCSLGDERQAAELAGYRAGSGERLLRVPAVRAFLERRGGGTDGAVASADEVLQYLTRVLRADAGASSMKAAELLGKRLGLFAEQGEPLPPPVIVDDVRRPPEGGRRAGREQGEPAAGTRGPAGGSAGEAASG